MNHMPESTVAKPTLEEFLAMPSVAHVAPQTLILGAGGTRRRAVMAGLSPHSDEYPRWTRREMIACHQLIFEQGVQHILSPMLVDSHLNEITPDYIGKLMRWTQWSLGGPDALEDYARLNWRVRLIGAQSWPELMPLAEQLAQATASHDGPTVWFTVASNIDMEWERILRIAVEQQITDRPTLVSAVYGEAIPPATLYLGTGKPQIVESIVLPLLVGKLECYWRQHLGYDLDVRTFRTILYDFAYIRPTWRADKTGRAEQVLAYQDAWTQPPVIGMGVRLGPFWYPAPIAPVAPNEG